MESQKAAVFSVGQRFLCYNKLCVAAVKKSGMSQGEVDTAAYAAALDKLLVDLQKKYGYNELDSILVLKSCMEGEESGWISMFWNVVWTV